MKHCTHAHRSENNSRESLYIVRQRLIQRVFTFPSQNVRNFFHANVLLARGQCNLYTHASGNLDILLATFQLQ